RALAEDKSDFAKLDASSADHYGELVALDRSVGMLRKKLRDSGIAENTLLVFNSDNGGLPGITPETVGGLRGFKGSVYEGGLRVPAIIEWPSVIKPRVTSYPASTMDLFPTVADILKMPEDVMIKPVDGRSLRPLFDGEIGSRKEPIPFRFGSKAALVDNRYKIMTENLEKGSFQLFDLEVDPNETQDITAEQPEMAERLKKQLLAWNETVNASFAGKDYPEGSVTPPDPEPVFWYETEAYKTQVAKWKDRWEYESYMNRQAKGKKQEGKGKKKK
ncbi:MAG: sulfatase-like hydrolase/transferase, partial [Prosthecobacter sp.]|nr:sulfatase-like hydrolase/transferase [Prosthecobacter sp.]